MKNWTIRAKITLLFIVCMTVVLGFAYAVFFVSHEAVVRHLLQSDLEETLESDLDQVTWHEGEGMPDPVNGLLFLPCADGYLEIDEDFLDLMAGVGVGLYDGDGHLLYGKNPIPAESAGIAFSEGQRITVHSGPDVFYVYDRQIASGGDSAFWLRGAVDRGQRREEVSQVFMVSLVLLPLLILLAAGGGYLITRRSLAPIRQFIDTAGSIGSGSDLQQRIHIDVGPRNEIQQLVTSFNSMMQRLEGSFEAEKRFTSDVSHELRTPMATILAQCELALEEGELTETEARDALLVIHRQGERMNDLIEDMLTYTRIERQHERYPMLPLDLAALVRETCREFQTRHEGVSLTVEAAEGADGIAVCGNALLLERLLSNLLENAFRYGGEGVSIRVRLEKAGCGAATAGPPAQHEIGDTVQEIKQGMDGEPSVRLQVTDDGPGIAAEDLPHIFDRFYQADPARSGEGTGLGLAMVKEIAGLHGGSVTADSRLGAGSAFTVYLPAFVEHKKTK